MKKVLSLLLSILFISATFAGCAASYEEAPITETLDCGITVEYYQDENGAIDLHTARQETFLDSNSTNIKKLAKGEKPYDKSNSITYKYDKSFAISLSENEDMTDARAYNDVDGVITVDGLKLNKTYYAVAYIDGKEVELEPFKTSGCCPRIINVDGVKNVRDIGGWKTEDGKTVKQGMIYRCGRLNESNSEAVNIEITEQGKSVMLNELGIKSDIDLRVDSNGEIGGITCSPLGESINYYNLPMSYAHDFYLDSKDLIVKEFQIFADINNYPIIFHCNIGTDRTGMTAFLLNGLLGVSEEDLYKDYLFSNFADIGGSRNVKGITDSSYYEEIQECEGDTLSEKIHNLLLKLGVTEEEIQSIISIMKE